MLEQTKDPRTGFTAAVHPRGADTPLVDFTTGDTVNAPTRDGGTDDVRVMAVTVTEDQNGRLHFVPELGVVRLDPIQRHERSIRAMAAGTISGMIGSASPGTAPAPVGRSRGLGAGVVGRGPFLVIGHADDGIPGLVPDYVCDGTDDADRWNAAAADANTGDGSPAPILVMPGTYTIKETISGFDAGQGISAYGGGETGIGGAVLVADEDELSGWMLQLNSGSWLSGLNFYGTEDAADGFQLHMGGAGCVVQRCTFANDGTPGRWGIGSGGGSESKVIACNVQLDGIRAVPELIQGCDLAGLAGEQSGMRLLGNYFNGVGLVEIVATKCMISGNRFIDTRLRLMHDAGGGAGNGDRNFVTGNFFDGGDSGDAVLIDSGADDNNVTNNDMDGLVVTDNGSGNVTTPNRT